MIITDIKKYLKKDLKGSIHIGAHHGEEKNWYKENNISPILWIDANSEYLDVLNTILEKDDRVIISGMGNSNETKTFHVSNNGQSSSFLKLGTHKYQHPWVFYTKEYEIQIRRMIDLVKEENIIIQNYNFINLDVQGYELEVLKGFDDLLNDFDYIYTEVNRDYLYENCALISDLDDYLYRYNFKRVETEFTEWGWGDALYIK